MAYNILMPKLGLTMQEGTVSRWLKKEGDEVKKDEPIVEIMTDKITNQMEAAHSGILKKILVEEGQTAKVSEVIGIIADPNEEVTDIPEDKKYTKEQSPDSIRRVTQDEEKESSSKRLRISPAARRLAKEKGVVLEKVVAAGPGGRIMLEDVKRYLEKQISKEETVKGELQEEKDKEAEVIPLRGMRKIISDRMTQSWHNSPHVTITMEADMTEAAVLREKIKQKYNRKITFTDLIVKACAKGLKDFPMINATLENEKIKQFKEINIGVAVALDDGLIVPVVFSADKKGLFKISEEVKALVEKARKGELSSDKVKDGSFTVTNLGMYGVDVFTPIINPPESAILGIGRITRKPVVCENNEIKIKPMMWLSLSFDHRLIDGALAAQFLSRVKDYLEDPVLIGL
jgi:pyruvate dehydrogenase E2 component (dihydrolipoamide acetyltransferase)